MTEKKSSKYAGILAKRIANTVANNVTENESNEMVYTKESFFTDDNPANGICSKEAFVSYIENLTENEMFGLDNLFETMKNRQRFTKSRIRQDRSGKGYIWITMRSKFIQEEGFKVSLFDSLEKLIEQYGLGRVQIDETININTLYEFASENTNADTSQNAA